MGLELFYLGFIELSDSRQIGMALGPIPWKAVHDYCIANDLDEDQTEAMHYHLKQMDAIYLKHQGKKK